MHYFVLLCVRLDWQGVIYNGLLAYGQTLNSDLCCQRLGRLKEAIAHMRSTLANRIEIAFYSFYSLQLSISLQLQ